MGSQSSKKTDNSTHPPSRTNSISQVNPDLSSYEAACRVDPDLQFFDSTLQERASRVINYLAVDIELRSLSLDSLREVTESLLEINQEVVKHILEYKNDIWKHQELLDLVEDYFNNSLKTLNFCTALEKCLKRARDGQLIVQVALQRFEEEQKEGISGQETSYSNTLQELRNFKAVGDPFAEDFFSLFRSVYNHQVLMLEKLQVKKSKLDNKLKTVEVWRKVFNIIFSAVLASVWICSVVAAAITAPPVLTALAAAASVPLASMRNWFNSIGKKYEDEIKGQREIINSMEFRTCITIKDLDSIRVLVDKLVIDIESLLQSVDFALKEEEAVMLAVDEIKRNMSGFMQAIDDLGEHADKCSSYIRKARTVILQRIIKHPND